MNFTGVMQWLFSVPALLMLPTCYGHFLLAGVMFCYCYQSVMGILVFSGPLYGSQPVMGLLELLSHYSLSWPESQL